jgi:hypothetical protein
MEGRKLEIQQAIIEIENPYPNDNLISCYKDFLEVRDYLKYYQFNVKVFTSLIELTYHLWDSSERINRISLLQAIKQYGYFINPKKSKYEIPICKTPKLPVEINTKLFGIFKHCFNPIQKLSKNRAEYAAQICNTLLINRTLCEDDEKWLCDNAGMSKMILNRLLRYPSKSDVITSWVKDSFLKDELRPRRAELISWILDKNPDYEVDKNILIDDFEYLNSLDKKAVDNFIAEKSIEYQLKKDLKDIFPNTIKFDSDDEHHEYDSINLTTRFYGMPTKGHVAIPLGVPDFERLNTQFFNELNTTIKLTMIWGITYSRMSNIQKTELLKKYYCYNSYWSLLKISKRYKLLDLLKWMGEVVS